MAENCTFEQLRHRIRSGQLLASPATRAALSQMLRALADEADSLADDIDAFTASPTKQRYSEKEAVRELKRWRPDWGVWHITWPEGSMAYLATLGITYDEETKKWSKL